jgi:hypothetical protein
MYRLDSEILSAKEGSKEELLTKPNVVGVGIGRKVSDGDAKDELSVVVLVEKKVSLNALTVESVVPSSVFGVPTDVMEVGRLEAQVDRKAKHRPAPGGVSIGHFAITAGTLGTVAIDQTNGDRVILSNNHVLANSNDAMIGDVILQQGYHDGGRVVSHTIGYLRRYKEIDFGTAPSECPIAEGVAKVINRGAKVIKSRHRLEPLQADPQAINYIDAAIAEPIDDDVILDEILDIGAVNGTIDAHLGMKVRKSGRTTGYTHGTVTLLGATVSVQYGAGKIARFENQIITDYMSAGGDSGSLGVHEDSNKAFGLLYAGSDRVTIFNRIQDVEDILTISL